MNTPNVPAGADYQDQITDYFARVQKSIKEIVPAQINELLVVLNHVRDSGSTVFVAGNGGSAATSEHVALDWMLGTGLSNPPLRVISLADSSASITATGNDLDFGVIFSRQLNSLASQGDVLVVISASGNSPNLLSLVEAAKKLGLRTIAMTGFDGGRLAQLADFSLHVPTADGDYGVAEDLHLMIGHAVKEVLMAVENHGD